MHDLYLEFHHNHFIINPQVVCGVSVVSLLTVCWLLHTQDTKRKGTSGRWW